MADNSRSMDRKAVFEPYDMDTAIGTNNSGVLMFNPFLEDTDRVSSVITGDGGGSEAPVFNAQDSVLWNNLRDAFRGERTTMYRNLRANGIWSYQKLVKLFEDHQSKWPEAIFNEDAYVKYITPLAEAVSFDDNGNPIKTDRYLTMLQGSKAEQRKWWLYNRLRYMDSKYNTGDASANVINIRFFNDGVLILKAAVPAYLGVSFGGGTTPMLQRADAGQGVNFAYQTPAGVTEMETWIYSADLITDVGDLSQFYPNECDFSKAVKLRRLKIGDNTSGYSNANLTTLNVQNCRLLEYIDCRNCPRLAITVNLENSPRLAEGYFENTAITGVDLTDGGYIETLHLPGTITTLTLLNLSKLSDLVVASYANISRLMLANIDQTVLNPVDVLEAVQAGSQVNIQGLYLTLADADAISDFFDLLDTMTGVTRERSSTTGEWIYHEEEKAVISGEVHTNALTGNEIATFNQRYPYIRVTADHTSSYLRYWNDDGTALLYTETIIDGGNGANPPAATKTATAQYTYTHNGWSRTKGQEVNEANALSGVTADRDVYATFSKTVNKYTVTWKNSDGTVLETDTNQAYGTTPAYNGATPTKDGQTATGWTPAVGPVTGNTVYTATYKPQYTATFVTAAADGGQTLQSSKWEEGATPVYSGATPTTTKGTAEERPFVKWNPTPGPITANTTYTAVFKSPLEVPTATSADGAYGVEWDYSNSATALTRKGLAASFADPVPATAIAGSGSSPFDTIAPWKDIKRYNIINNEVSYSSDDAGYSETDYDTVVWIPVFYYTAYKDTANNKWLWAISPTPLTGFVKHPGSGRYVGRFHTTGSSSEVGSKSGVAPLASVTRANFRTYSHNKGAKWYMIDLAGWSAIQMLYLVEFANWHSQDKLGKGQNSSSVGTTGLTAGATYHTLKGDKTSIGCNMYRWIENPFSQVMDWCDGFVASARAAYAGFESGTYTDTTSSLEATGIILPGSQYITGFGWSEQAPFAFIPDAASGGSASTFVPDYVGSSTGVLILRVGGLYYDGDGYGFFCFYASSSASNTSANIGSRLQYIP